MKKLTKLLSLLLVFVLAMGIVACSSFGKVEDALTDLGYTLEENSNEADKYEDEKITNAYVFKKVLDAVVIQIPSYVIVLEFNSTDDLVAYFEESETLKGLIKDITKNEDLKKVHAALESKGYACDNCLIINLALDPNVNTAISELNK